jgi:hypothetical protein
VGHSRQANPDHGRVPVNPKAAKHGTAPGNGRRLRQFEIDEPSCSSSGFWQQTTPTEKRWTNVQAVAVTPEKLWKKTLAAGHLKSDLEKLDCRHQRQDVEPRRSPKSGRSRSNHGLHSPTPSFR